jgi:hypothetical protein
MPDDYVDPVDQVEASRPIEGRGTRPVPGPLPHATISGRVIAVRKKTPKHAESHRLDASIGGQSYSEIVIQIDEGDVSDLAGKRVAIHYRED